MNKKIPQLRDKKIRHLPSFISQVIISQIDTKINKQFLSKYAMRYLRNDKTYSGNTRLKKSQKAGQK